MTVTYGQETNPDRYEGYRNVSDILTLIAKESFDVQVTPEQQDHWHH